MNSKCEVFTPDKITALMTNKLGDYSGSLLDPSVGTGNLLKYLDSDRLTKIDVYDLKKDYLDQIDNRNVDKHNEDFLKNSSDRMYDNIIMNPPYIRVQDLTTDYRTFIKNSFPIIKNGLVDIYYAFIIKCINHLSKSGTMVSITPNSYLYNKASKNLRQFLINNRYIKEIIDFKHEKVFENVSVYCCITVFTKSPKEYIIYNNSRIKYADIKEDNYSIFDLNHESTTTSCNDTRTLKDLCKISNGIATLRDNIYIHKNKLFEEPCWNIITNGRCVKYVIFPYDESGKIIEENNFKNKNPQTYAYLNAHRDELVKRDKGKKTYATWYAYGRTQSILKPRNQCIYVPCFVNPLDIENCMKDDIPMLSHGCLCIEPKNQKDISKIKKSIVKNIEYVTQNSSKRSGGWINLSSTLLYKVPVSGSD